MIATLLGYTTLFGCSITFEVLALIVLLALVKEPRLRKAAAI